jgi:hypothetical protein
MPVGTYAIKSTDGDLSDSESEDSEDEEATVHVAPSETIDASVTEKPNDAPAASNDAPVSDIVSEAVQQEEQVSFFFPLEFVVLNKVMLYSINHPHLKSGFIIYSS